MILALCRFKSSLSIKTLALKAIAKAGRVGCAVASCASGSPFNGHRDWTLVVCNYEPFGNIVGQKPY